MQSKLLYRANANIEKLYATRVRFLGSRKSLGNELFTNGMTLSNWQICVVLNAFYWVVHFIWRICGK